MVSCLLSATGTIVTIAVGVAAVGIVIFSVIWHFVRKKQGKTGCGCDCSGCSGCSACRPKEKKEQNASEKK
ncbi:MAG TPA: FeoB-associated Cys-rich membrane protein [Candidatus Borkfalkia excrementavium]|uniref:FeoB-associated Cys-rich membrane protein n=1 Tax=Candidatus Borkfalkia excrementavium TaxID=2838505 RepID=A0A9D2CFB5_9FIRM|nr:FeoB-associated Cys-rich membrane protein [Candidatus Borkfalkia excrementavium]